MAVTSEKSAVVVVTAKFVVDRDTVSCEVACLARKRLGTPVIISTDAPSYSMG